MNKIIGKYFLKELVTTWFAVTLILLIILSTNKFTDVIGDIASGDLPSSSLFQVIFYSSIDYLVILIPLSTFLSILMVLGRFYKNSEMTAILSSGVGPSHLYRVLSGPLVVLIASLLLISVFVSPQAKKSIELSKQNALTKIGIEFFEPGRFITLKDGAVFYSKERLGNNRFLEVFMQTEINGEVSVVTAEYAEIQGTQGNNLLVFFNGQRYQGKPGNNDFRVLEFSEHQLPLFISKTNKETKNISTESMSNLLRQSDLLAQAEIQWRLSPSIALLILVFLAVPLSKASPRQGQYGGLVLGVLVYMIYVNLLGAARVWFEQGDSPQVIGLWWVHCLGFIFTLFMILTSYNFFSRLTTIREKK